jgi:chorismate mutase
MCRKNTPPIGGVFLLLRKRIDRIDRKLLGLLHQRAALALRVGQIKRQRGLPVFDARREEAVLRQVTLANQGPLPQSSLRKIFHEILCQSRRLEAKRHP